MTKKEYRGIDIFRLVACVMIIAIHTFPLEMFSPAADYVFTRVIARVAVPFFMMTSGFFLISKYTKEEKLWSFVKKTALIYIAAIIIYLPINIYQGYFAQPALLCNIIGDIVFDGTLYHLWYLPGAVFGAVIAHFATKKLGYKKALILTAALYFIGLFGDSYFGILKYAPPIERAYGMLFELFDYTRNGIFFVPVFFVMGGIIRRRRQSSAARDAILFSASLLCMTAEGMLLYMYAIPRHTSFYIFLLPCVYYLFALLVRVKGKRISSMRDLTLYVYIIHPLVIVALRVAAGIVGLEWLLVDNSLVHFVCVTLGSFAAAGIFMALMSRCKPKKPDPYGSRDRSWIEINYENLAHNVKEIERIMPNGCKLMAIMKAEGYGHGAYECATYLEELGVDAFAVATLDEGIELRRMGIEGEILVLGYTSPYRAGEIAKFKITQTVIDYAYAKTLNSMGVKVHAHIKIDSGMHRLGIPAEHTDAVAEIYSMKNIAVSGIYTHLCVSDSLKDDDVAFTHSQLDRFDSLVERLRAREIDVGKVHTQASAGLLNYPELKYDYVRAGVVLYGVLSSVDDDVKVEIDMRPVLSLKTRVALVRDVARGESVGYGRAFVAERDSKIAILPIGYCDGVPRVLSGGGSYALIKNSKAPIVGRICMDQMAVDVTDMENVSAGDVALLIEDDGESEISTVAFADKAGTIGNEIISRMGRRLKIEKNSFKDR